MIKTPVEQRYTVEVVTEQIGDSAFPEEIICQNGQRFKANAVVKACIGNGVECYVCYVQDISCLLFHMPDGTWWIRRGDPAEVGVCICRRRKGSY